MFNRINPLQSLVVDNDTLGDFVSKLYYPSLYRFDVIPVKTLSKGFDRALARGFTHAVTLDADGQHRAKDIVGLAEAAERM